MHAINFFMRRWTNLLLIGMCWLFSSSGVAQEDSWKHHPWPPIYGKEYPKHHLDTPSKSINNQLFVTNLFQDTTQFSEVSTTFPGVIAGDAVWVDYDNDGDLDVIVSGYADTGMVTRIYRNDGNGVFTDIQAPIAQLASERGIAWGDYDNDGDFDLAIEGRTDISAKVALTKIYRNDNGTFTDINAPLIQVQGGSVTWVDVNNDGRLDLLVSGSPDVGSTFYTRIYRQTSAGEFVPFKTYVVYPTTDSTGGDTVDHLPGVWGSTAAWGDYNNDGVLDLLLSGYGDFGVMAKLFRTDIISDSILVFTNTQAPLLNMSSSTAAWGDYDNDGYLDLVTTGCPAGYDGGGTRTVLYHNDHGTLSQVDAPFKNLGASSLAWGDYDNDGWLDLAIEGAEDGTYGTNPTTKIYHNDHGTFTDINAVVTGTWFGSVAWGDYDNDGKLDLLVTGGTVDRPSVAYAGPYYPITKIYKNLSTTSNTPPSAPDSLVATVDSGTVHLSWNRATDNQTPVTALTYNIRIGTKSGAYDIISPASNTASGFRRVPKSGNTGYKTAVSIKGFSNGTYYWSVQAVDGAYAGSTFSTEQALTTPYSDAILHTPVVPLQYTLGQNYPNPFNPSTDITYRVAEATHVSLKVFDLLGQPVADLVEQLNQPGNYKITWDTGNLPAGVYFYRLQAGTFFETKKMLLIR